MHRTRTALLNMGMSARNKSH